MANFSSAEAVWKGALADGQGTVTMASGAAPGLGVSWPARVERESSGQQTSPEEMIAAAWASCFAMALSHGLGSKGNAPEQLNVTARVEFGKTEGGFGITAGHLAVRGRVPGIDQATFEQAAQGAKDGCPVSRALKGNVPMDVEATLEG